MQNNISRRAALAALAGAGALASVPAASAALDTGAPATTTDEHGEGYTDAMDTFAMGWLTRWTSKGGTVSFDPATGKAWIGYPAYSFSPVRKQDDARKSAAIEAHGEAAFTPFHWERECSWNNAFYTGKMRELSDLLNAVPGGLEAVKRIVRAFPSAGLAPVFANSNREA